MLHMTFFYLNPNSLFCNICFIWLPGLEDGVLELYRTLAEGTDDTGMSFVVMIKRICICVYVREDTYVTHVRL